MVYMVGRSICGIYGIYGIWYMVYGIRRYAYGRYKFEGKKECEPYPLPWSILGGPKNGLTVCDSDIGWWWRVYVKYSQKY